MRHISKVIQMFNRLRIRCLESSIPANEICLGLGLERWRPLRLFWNEPMNFHG